MRPCYFRLDMPACSTTTRYINNQVHELTCILSLFLIQKSNLFDNYGFTSYHTPRASIRSPPAWWSRSMSRRRGLESNVYQAADDTIGTQLSRIASKPDWRPENLFRNSTCDICDKTMLVSNRTRTRALESLIRLKNTSEKMQKVPELLQTALSLAAILLTSLRTLKVSKLAFSTQVEALKV